MLNVQVNLGSAEASKDVVVTVAPLPPQGQSDDVVTHSWSDFVAATYGSCAGQGLERLPQGEFEAREPME